MGGIKDNVLAIRMKPELVEWIRQKSDEDNRTVSGWVNHVLMQMMRKEREDEIR